MSKPMDEDRGLAAQMSSCRLAEPSPELRERVLRRAHSEWQDAMVIPFVPWTTVTLRLAASLAIAVAVVWAANLADRRSLARWEAPHPPARETGIVAGMETIRQDPAGWSRLATAAASLPRTGASRQLLQYARRVNQMLRTASTG